MGRKLLGGAVGALGMAGQVARHAVWYLRYRIDGSSRDEAPRTPGRTPRS